ncbi:rod-binding protein [Aestuariibacter sp. A3R04]|uniref:rod-binding protein n=1 Tax=Aestuariibacter sp. A3R04 TaxID=2841571 RepID=UPI001C0839BD|nr:rod-binding protein [Aestuariibacter sp. A3R04]MBU3023138.1 rod-binding protein [Aestuariibacter sp. A3R04]
MTIETSLNHRLAIDPTEVNQIYANLNESDSLKQAAQQFEAIFLQLVLKSMNNTTNELSGDANPFSSREQQHYQDMYSAQLSQQLSSTGQIGLAEQIVHQTGEKISEVKNKFKEMAEPVAYSGHSEAFYQPLISPVTNEGINK